MYIDSIHEVDLLVRGDRKMSSKRLLFFPYPYNNAHRKSRFVCDLISNDYLSDLMFSYCCARSLLLLRKTNKYVSNEVLSYMRRVFDINRRLSHFFPDPISFRTLQALTGTLISGSFALQFFDRTFYPGSDLDIYVHRPWSKAVGLWLLQRGYEFRPNSSQEDDFLDAITDPRFLANSGRYFMRGVAGVFNFVIPDPRSGEELKVQLIVAANTPMEIVLNFHSSMLSDVIFM